MFLMGWVDAEWLCCGAGAEGMPGGMPGGMPDMSGASAGGASSGPGPKIEEVD